MSDPIATTTTTTADTTDPDTTTRRSSRRSCASAFALLLLVIGTRLVIAHDDLVALGELVGLGGSDEPAWCRAEVTFATPAPGSQQVLRVHSSVHGTKMRVGVPTGTLVTWGTGTDRDGEASAFLRVGPAGAPVTVNVRVGDATCTATYTPTAP